MDELLFEWDEEKNQHNIDVHGISFDIAKHVFEDEFYIEYYDEEHSSLGEERYQVIGLVYDVLFVVYTERNEKIRLISARLAEEDEKEVYYAHRKQS